MELFPAIDLMDRCAVRLLRGDYAKKTVYSADPVQVAKGFRDAGANFLHVVDLDGARDGGTPNLETVERLVSESGLLVEVGGGIRTADRVKRYLDAGAFRVILGTAAMENRDFLKEMLSRYGERIAVGADVRDGQVAVRGWTKLSGESCFSFCQRMEDMGVKTIIATDISRDGLLSGTNLELYRELTARFSMDFVASGGITTAKEVRRLRDMGLSGAILGKALYTGDLDLREALEATSGEEETR